MPVKKVKAGKKKSPARKSAPQKKKSAVTRKRKALRPARSFLKPAGRKAVLAPKPPAIDIPNKFVGVGLDVGTSNLVAARVTEKGEESTVSKNAFLYVREDDTTKELLTRMNIPQQMVNGKLCVVGKNAYDFSNYFDRRTQRSMNIGVINPLEREAIHVINLIVSKMLWKPRVANEVCSFSLPGQPVDSAIDITYHRNVIETMLSCFGFEPLPINEAFAVVLSELKDQKFTGVGVSCGGGMVNVCITYTSVVIAEFSIARGGDWIDQRAANAVDVSVNKILLAKEKGMSIVGPESREEESIAIYYRQYIRYSLEQIAKVLHTPDTAAQFDGAVDIVFAGGSSMVGGFIDVVRKELRSVDLGIKINEARMAADPFLSVSRGCLLNAQMASG
ncbi:MAG: hypothetical protein HQL20_06995 [Candidatus Omnitrophica bacterium]|nr:hypothetical protein [Candidatus Omnitrophota bacterium]